MRPNIEAILFDIGGTLRANQSTGGRDLSSIRKLQACIGDQRDPLDFADLIRCRELEYRKWAQRSLLESTEVELWTKYLLPDYPADLIQKNVMALNGYWRESQLNKILPDAVDTIRSLSDRGYKLGIISNTTTSIEGPTLIRENGIESLFKTLILSTVFGRRKPHPSIFLEAAEQIGVLPEHCAYVGDQLSRDLIGPRQAGYGEVVIIDIRGYDLQGTLPDDDIAQNNCISAMEPDFKIQHLSELLTLYPDANHHEPKKFQPVQLYDAALSTMWGVDQRIPFNQTFEIGRKVGFARFELNHAVTPQLFEQWDKNRFYIGTVHDPCPAVFLNSDIKRLDYQISSLDERCRIKGVDMAKRTIQVACELGARSVVLHPGMIQCDDNLERRLREMYRKGHKATRDYADLKLELVLHRKAVVAPYFDQVVKSMKELIEFARPTGIELGLENRYHYYDIPLIDEMQILLDLCTEDWYGFQYDCGHAQTLEALGFVSHEEWLKRFGQRIIGTHLHDVIGIQDHQMPGIGEVDFAMIASYLPVTAHRTLELSSNLSPDDLRKSLDVLADAGCIQRI